MTITRKQFWEEAYSEIEHGIEELKGRTESELRHLIAFPETKEFRRGRFVAVVTSWVQEQKPEVFCVMVEVRQERFGGLFSTVSANGFFREADHLTRDMTEEELWENGY